MKISIITTSYNSERTIRDTLNSINNQDYNNIEHIIIDGKSIDKTLKIVSEFPRISKVVSEDDDGLYYAMNKGLKLATGDIVGFLNSDDLYSDSSVITRIMSKFAETSSPCLYGDLQYVDTKNLNRVVRTWRSGEFKRSKFYYGWMPPHPSFFVHRNVYKVVGGFNTSLNTSADYELMLRILLKHNFNAVYLPHILVKMRTGGLSNASFLNRIVANKEDRIAWKLNDLNPYFFTLYCKPVRKLVQYLIK